MFAANLDILQLFFLLLDFVAFKVVVVERLADLEDIVQFLFLQCLIYVDFSNRTFAIVSLF